MPAFKRVAAGLVLSTAVTGSVVGLGAMTAASAARATVASTTATPGYLAHCSRGHCKWAGWARHHGRQRVIIHIHIRNKNWQTQTQAARENEDQARIQSQRLLGSP